MTIFHHGDTETRSLIMEKAVLLRVSVSPW